MPTYEVALILRKMAHTATVQALKRTAGEIYSSGGYIRYEKFYLIMKPYASPSRRMQSLGERELPNIKHKGAGNKYSEGLYFLMDMDIRYVLLHIILNVGS